MFMLDWCKQDFTTSVTNGSSSTEEHDSVSGFSQPDPKIIGKYLTARPNDGINRIYTVGSTTHHILQNYFRVLIHGRVNTTNINTLSLADDAIQALFQPFNIFGEKLDGVDPVPGRSIGQAGLQRILDNVATGMTNMQDMDSLSHSDYRIDRTLCIRLGASIIVLLVLRPTAVPI